MEKLNELSVDHPYYSSSQNYYSNEPDFDAETMTEFLDAAEQWDVDLNLMYRWDFHKRENGTVHAEAFFILQRKGIYKPCKIDSVSEDEAVRFEKFAKKHWEKLKEIWQPISN